MRIPIIKIFGQIIGGLALFFVVIPGLDWAGIFTFGEVWKAVQLPHKFPILIEILIGLYIIGTVIDILGLPFDQLFDRWICSDYPTDQQRKNFWPNVSSHVLSYRDEVWAFYYCYRNLLILLVPGIILWFGALAHRGQWGVAFVVVLILVVMGFILFNAMRTLLKLYYDITKSFCSTSDKSGQMRDLN